MQSTIDVGATQLATVSPETVFQTGRLLVRRVEFCRQRLVTLLLISSVILLAFLVGERCPLSGKKVAGDKWNPAPRQKALPR